MPVKLPAIPYNKRKRGLYTTGKANRLNGPISALNCPSYIALYNAV